ncbi:MAG: DDE-type integrase/transposase/recombinase [Thaumarchaeota archaeon]|nr:DDE-type integrase/transposase/recombinase [Nitrososphaerota archaeon]
MPNMQDMRITKGLELSQSSEILENVDGSFWVPSQTDSEKVYKVSLLHNEWVCECPDFQFRHITCKHTYAVKFCIAVRNLNNEPLPNVVSKDAIQCVRCGSIQVMKYGKLYGRQAFRCKDCGKKFREQTLIKKAKYDTEIITITLDLYFKGISLRKVSDHLKQFYGLDVPFQTVHRWLDTYVKMMNQYVATLTPQLTGKWHEDEMAIKVKGEMKWLWNVMDHGTRMQLASEISQTKNEVDSMKAFLRAKEIAKTIPKEIITDKMGATPMGIERAFIREGKPKHTVAISGATTPHANEWAERLHNTIRERNKTQRGWKSDNTPLREGQRLYYNFIRGHQSLNGLTPAQMAGLDKETWMSLLQKALTKS